MDETVKVAVIGDTSVGKTSIIQQALFTEFKEEHYQTETANCYYVTLFSSDKLFHIKLIDTPRFEENDKAPQNEWVKLHCYKRCSLFVMVYDVNRDESFGYIKAMHNEIAKHLDSNEFPVIVVGNKIDLSMPPPHKDISHNYFKKEIANFSKKIMKANYIECSCKYNWHIVQFMKEVARMLEAYEENVVKMTNTRSNLTLFRRQQCIQM